MKTFPVHLITDLDSLRELKMVTDEAFGNRDFQCVESIGKLIRFLESCYLSFIETDSIDKSEIDENPILRIIIDNKFNGRSNTAAYKSLDDLTKIEKAFERDFLFQLSLNLFSLIPHGMADISIQSVPKDWNKFYKATDLTFIAGGSSTDFTNWNAIGLHKFPIDTLTIVDPYLLSDWRKANLNLTEIISGLIGKRNPKETITLNLFVTKDGRLKPEEFQQLKSENLLRLNKLVSGIYPNKQIKSNIFYIPTSLMHDRCIFTNYYYIYAGAGFNLFEAPNKLSTQKSNNLEVHVIKDYASFQNYKKRLVELKSWFEKYSNTLEYSGEIPHRIFNVL